MLQHLADEKYDGTHWEAYYEYIRTEIIVPVVDFSSFIVPKELNPPAGLSRVAIQGNFEQYRRDYKGTFEDLFKSFEGALVCGLTSHTLRSDEVDFCICVFIEDPAAWGYLPLSLDDPMGPYKPDPASEIPPFELHLLGGRGELDIPVQLKDVVKIHFRLVRYLFTA